MLARQLAGAGIPGLGNVSNANQRLIGVLAHSRSFADTMVVRVAGPRPSGKTAGQLRRMLAMDTEVTPRPDGSIAIQVEGEDPRLTAKVANTFPVLLNEMSARVGVEAAVQKQHFLETQLRRARAALDRSEQRLVSFQKQRNAPELQDQATRTVDAAAQLQGQITEQEVRVSELRRTVTPSNAQLQSAEARLSALRGQMRRLTGGGGGGLFVPFSESPDLAATLTRLKRDYQRDEQVYISLTTAIAQSQIDVNNNLPVVSVLDQATVPGEPSGIGLKLILVLAAALGLMLGLVAAFVAEHFARARHDPAAGSFFVAWEDFKHDVVPLRRRSTQTAGRR
jgi:tyrosine-protein kinase Etk/Wzc